MSRYIRVRATRPQGCHRAGMFHGVKPVVYDTNELTVDQLKLLGAENGRLLLVDEVAGPEDAGLVPDGDKVDQVKTFVSHPQMQDKLDSVTSELNELKGGVFSANAERDQAVQAQKDEKSARERAEAMCNAAQKGKADAEAQVVELQKQLAEAQGERDAAVQNAEHWRAAADGSQRARVIADAVRRVVASGEGMTAAGVPKVDALEVVAGFNITAAERDAAWLTHSDSKA